MDNNEIIEPTVSEAMIMLKNYVYDRGFSVKVNLQSGGVSIYGVIPLQLFFNICSNM